MMNMGVNIPSPRGIITGCHNVACRLVMKANKGSLAGCVVHWVAGSTNGLT